jgi:hypothetical protein
MCSWGRNGRLETCTSGSVECLCCPKPLLLTCCQPWTSLQVFLSATLSNAREFSEWVAHLHKQPCHVVYTDFRPTPLHHFVVPVAGQGMYKVRTRWLSSFVYCGAALAEYSAASLRPNKHALTSEQCARCRWYSCIPCKTASQGNQ